MGYITYEEYTKLGGECSEKSFPLLQFDCERKMDYITFGRLSKMIDNNGIVPDAVKMLEVKLVNIENSSGGTSQQTSGLTSYSNGIESFGFDTSKDSEVLLLNKFSDLMLQYLYPEYPELFYRGRWVDSGNYNHTS